MSVDCCTHVILVKLAEAGVAFPKFSLLLVDESWLEVLREELQKQYMDKLYRFVLEEASGKFPIYPPAAKVFNAFNTCPFNSVKVVILGQVRTCVLMRSSNPLSGFNHFIKWGLVAFTTHL